MRKTCVILSFVISFGLYFSAPASAFLLGDQVNLGHAFPTSSDIIDGHFVTVETGLGDQTQFGGVYSVNPEDSWVEFSFFHDFTFSSEPFNGQVIDFIDTPLTSVQVDTNLAGWDSTRTNFNTSRVEFNWSGLSVSQGTYFTAYLNNSQFPSGAVPEPSSLALFGLGVFGLFFNRKKKKI